MVIFAGLQRDEWELTDSVSCSSDTLLPAVVLPVLYMCLGKVDIKNMGVFGMGMVPVQPSN